MKRIIILTLVILLTGIVSISHIQADDITDQVTITVTSDKRATFDMFHNSKVVKGLTTPYEITFSLAESHFILNH